MTVNQSQTKNKDVSESLLHWQSYVLGFVAVVTAALVVLPVLPGLLSNIAYSFSGQAPKIYWYLSRAAGFVAFTILWISMVLGLGITNKMARLWPGAPTAFAIHEYISLLGLAFAVYHGLVLMGDHFVDFSLPRLLTPFSIAHKTVWVGLGQVSFYIWALVASSFYVRKWIGQKNWRYIHYANFAIFGMGLLHGLFSGTDSGSSWVRRYYWVCAASILILLAYRIYETSLKKRNLSLPVFSWQLVQQRILKILTRSWRGAAPILTETAESTSISLTDMAKVTETIAAPVENPSQGSQALEATEATPIKLEDPSVIEIPERAVLSEVTSGESKASERAFKDLMPETKHHHATGTLVLKLRKNEGDTETQPSESHQHAASRVHILDK